MVRSFRHKGLKRLYHEGTLVGLPPELLQRLEDVLANLDSAIRPSDLDLPGYRLHPLKGNLKGFWSVAISGNWRILFRMEDGDVYDLDLLDYH